MDLGPVRRWRVWGVKNSPRARLSDIPSGRFSTDPEILTSDPQGENRRTLGMPWGQFYRGSWSGGRTNWWEVRNGSPPTEWPESACWGLELDEFLSASMMAMCSRGVSHPSPSVSNGACHGPGVLAMVPA